MAKSEFKPEFDPKQYHMLIRGVDGVEYEQDNCYFNIRQEFVRRARNRPAPPDTSLRTKIPLKTAASAPVVLGKIENAAKENAEALSAEDAAD